MQEDQPQQTDVIFEFECQKRTKFAPKPYFGRLFTNSLHLYKQGTDNAKYCLPIQLKTHLKWDVAEISVNGKKHYQVQSFKFQQIKVSKDRQVAKITAFLAEENVLLQLKEHLRNKIIFQRIQDFYTPLQTLGKGSSSRVLMVRHKNTELYYAAKCVDKSYINETENGMASMFQEISINNELDHPSFIKLHAVYEGDNTFYMVMDLLEGKSLHDELQLHKTGFPEEVVRVIMNQVLEGIEYMHAKNIMHRDLKPENLMLMRKGDLSSLKIVDFGLSTHEDVDKYIFPKCGTPGYVAPEIANLVDKTKKYDKLCDIFSAGVIFYKLLSGKDLFPGNGFNQVLKSNKQCKIDLTPLLMKKTNQELIKLISNMLEKDPKDRPSATQVLAHPFFASMKNNQQKKNFFTTLKQQENLKISQTAEFHGGVPNDRQLNNEQRNPFTVPLKLSQPTKDESQKYSLVTQDYAYKPVNNNQEKNNEQQKMIKFNTTDFNPYLENSLQNNIQDKIEEEEESKN